MMDELGFELTREMVEELTDGKGPDHPEEGGEHDEKQSD